MRAAFIRKLTELAAGDRRIVLLTGDLGFMAIEPFAEAHPDRFFNVGVAEQNMTGVATGLAEAGLIPFTYSIVTFATLRSYEFIRNGPVLQGLPVRIIGVGGGFEYGSAGPTHYGLEDVAVTRAQPGLTVVAPADHQQAANALAATWDQPGPIYYRLGKDDKSLVPGLKGRFEIGRAQIVSQGLDVCFIAMGAVATEVMVAAEQLRADGVDSTVVVVASVAPPPVEDLAATLSRFRQAITVEAHYEVGGLGSLVAEVIAERGLHCQLTRCAVRESPSGPSGSQAYMQRRYGLDSRSLVQAARRFAAAA